MEILTYSEARNSLRSVLNRVIDDAEVAMIRCRSTENAVLMSQRYYDQLMETLHLTSTAANQRHLDDSIAQHRSNQAKRRALAAA